jgi:hypothetical protein
MAVLEAVIKDPARSVLHYLTINNLLDCTKLKKLTNAKKKKKTAFPHIRSSAACLVISPKNEWLATLNMKHGTLT